MFKHWVFALLCAGIAFGAADWTDGVKSGELFNKDKTETNNKFLAGLRYFKVDENTCRLSPKTISIGKLNFGEVLIVKNEEGGIHSLRIMVYNKGDDGAIEKDAFDRKVEEAVAAIDELTGIKGKNKKVNERDAGLKAKAVEWQHENGVIVLESASLGGTKKEAFKAEFIRLFIGPDAESIERGGASDATTRGELRGNIQKEEDGTVWLKNVPMVDQGQKGYCVPATLARLFAYYGMDGVDQHALAALCNSKSGSEGGTSLKDMEDAMNAICRKFHIRVQIIEDYANVVRTTAAPYNKIAKKENKAPFNEMEPFETADAEVLRQARAGKKANVDKWLKTIKKSVDTGIPVLWSVTLGIYQEKIPVPQQRGGHMRMIIGYNLQKRTVIYTDSWGASHEKKEIDAADAMSMTNSRYILRLSR